MARRDRLGGDYAGAEQLFKQVLEIKINAGGPKSVHAAISYNALGETQLELGKLEEAEENLSRAVEIRENDGPGSAFDAAVSRENLARIYEAKGRWDQARRVRTKNFGQMVCSNYKVSPEFLVGFVLGKYQDAPSSVSGANVQLATAASAAYYCSENCQVRRNSALPATDPLKSDKL